MDKVSLGKFISLILRHKPEVIGIKLDENGWADVDELISGIKSTGRNVNRAILKEIVNENDKKRYSFNDDETKIRANQGHSVSVDVELTAKVPPKYLYHGTAERFIKSIQEQGILKGSRQHVHLSEDIATAKKVGQRHGEPAIIKISTIEMIRDGIIFYQSVNNVWLCDSVPVQYFCNISK